MAVIRLKDPNAPKRQPKRRYDDDLSIQPSARMIAEQVIKRGPTKLKYLLVSFPREDQALADELKDLIPTVVKGEKTRQFYDRNNQPELPAEMPEGQEAEPVTITIADYRVAHTPENIAILYKFGMAHNFVFDGDIAVRAMVSTEQGKELERLSYAVKNETDLVMARLAGKPYHFQEAGVVYMLKTKKAINADQMGLGKTIQAILATATAKAYPALFIVPAQLRTSPWKRKWNEWAPKRKGTTIVADNSNIKSVHRSFRVKNPKTKKFETKKNDVVIVNYDRLGKYMKYLKKVKWRAIVLDESHYIKNRNADRTKAVIELVDAVKPEYVWLLSGTPIKADPEQLVSQLRVIDRLKDFGGRGNFMKRYCWKASAEDEFSDAAEDGDLLEKMAKKRHESSIELNHHLRALCYIRRNKDEVLHDLPAKTRETLKFKLNAHFRATYTQIETDLVSYLLDRALEDEKFLKSIKQLSKKEREFAITEYRAAITYKSARAEILQKIELCKQAAAAGKLEQAKEWIQNVLDSGEKLVVFMTHKRILRELEEYFPKVSMVIEGGQDRLATTEQIKSINARIDKQKNPALLEYKLQHGATFRDAEVSRFQTDPKCKLALCMIGAGGVGHTLHAASHVAFIELPWGPTDCDQAEDRCHRIGQKDNVTIHYLLAEDTIDEPIAELIESKRMVVNAVHDGDPLHGMGQGNILPDLIKILTKGKIVLLR